MTHTYYQIGEFARKASVSVRTLRHYDRIGLLSPSHHTEAGYRLYTDGDYPRLQQILALKYLGFSLEEIQRCLDHSPALFKDALAIQKAMLRERKAHLEAIIRTIEQTEDRLADGEEGWKAIVQILEVIQMKEKKEWIQKYFNAGQIQKMNELAAAAYTPEDMEKLSERGQGWTEEDQRQADRKWGDLIEEVKRLAEAGEDPAGLDAQALAERWMWLVNEFTQGDPGITAGLRRFWKGMGELPPEQSPLPKFFNSQQQQFWDAAMAIYMQSSDLA